MHPHPRRGAVRAPVSSTPRGGYRHTGAPSRSQGPPGPGIDARIKNDSDKTVVAQLNRSSNAETGLPLRPDFGSRGREISLRVNHFPVEVKGRIFRYSAAISLLDQRKITRGVKHHVFRLAEQTVDWHQAGMTARVAHDSAERLVASFELPQPLTIRGAYQVDEDKGTEYELTLTFNGQVDQALLNQCLQGQPVDSRDLAQVLSALNLVLTAHPSQTGVKLGRNDDDKKHPDQRIFFDTPEPKDIGGGLTARQGFYLSVRPAHQQLMVNVNTCHAAFYKPQNFVDAMREASVFGNQHTFPHNVRVKVRPTNRVVMIKGISKKNARQHSFKHNQYGFITVENYYKQKHGVILERPNSPLLEDPQKNLYPPELCDILPNEGFKGELAHGSHAKAMLDEACKLPNQNVDEIVNRGLDKLGFRNSNPVLDSFGVNVGTNMAVVPGRVLPKPGLTYSSNSSANIDGRASWNLRDLKFAVGARLDKWAVLAIQDGGRDDFRGDNDPLLRKITEDFRVMCNKCGMQVGPVHPSAYAQVQLPRHNRELNPLREDAVLELERSLKNLVQRHAPQLILVMLSNDDSAVYNGIKRLCDIKLDVASICMQSSKVKPPKRTMQYFANVALKANMKMGGINHMLDANSGTWLRSKSTMIMGMDVTHPTGKGAVGGAPSIVAVVASVDEHFAQYPAILGLRESRVEINKSKDDLVDLFVTRFELYKARNKGKLPERVILFRDGVSESQFAQVRRDELPQLEQAFARFGSYQPKLSIVVCGKRHNTRFYPTHPDDAARDGNPLPGTVVDRGVTPAYEFDFFLQAHASLKGTARPTHYFVVHDKNGLKADELQRVTNDLSYMFARATKAVSLVSPAYWADVACERGRCYLHEVLRMRDGDDTGSAATTDAAAKSNKGKGKGKAQLGPKKTEGDSAVFAKAKRIWGDGVSGPKLKDTMFYL